VLPNGLGNMNLKNQKPNTTLASLSLDVDWLFSTTKKNFKNLFSPNWIISTVLWWCFGNTEILIVYGKGFLKLDFFSANNKSTSKLNVGGKSFEDYCV